MYPGRTDPDFGVFVAQLERELIAQGHEIERAVIDQRGGSRSKYVRLGTDALRIGLRFDPEVVYAHFLVPTGALGALASVLTGAPLVVTAHGRDVRNIGEIPGVLEATKLTVRRAATIVAVSDYLRRELEAKLPELAGRVAVVDCGVDLDRFRGRDATEARARVGWDGEGPRFLFVGSMHERKNVLRLADAFASVETGQLVFVGDGPLRSALAGRDGIRLVGRVAHARVAEWIGACDVLCQPSLVEPFGQALLEAMASERSVVATRVGGPPEFVTPACGALVDPTSVESIADGLRKAAALPSPNVASRREASLHDVRVQAQRISRILADAVAR
jgi:glycosyltransferase involved in cell wall biosynthesis